MKSRLPPSPRPMEKPRGVAPSARADGFQTPARIWAQAAGPGSGEGAAGRGRESAWAVSPDAGCPPRAEKGASAQPGVSRSELFP